MIKKLSNPKLRHRLWAMLLALCMTLSMIPAFERPAEAAFSDASMDKLLDWGVLSGYPDGSLRPERNLTRAEFVAMVNRAYGYNTPAPTPFTDVEPASWYYDDIGSAYKVGYFNGVSPTSAAPDKELTREQAVVLIARNMRLDPIPGEVVEFSDGRECSDWSHGYIRAAQKAGMIGGYPDGSYHPQGDITRGEMSVMLQRALGSLINKPGEHTLSDVYGNVTISSPNSVLKNSTIAGDLYITGGLDLGDITLENVRVLGDIIVAGGGESQQGESIILRNVEADSLLVDSIADQYVSLCAEGNSKIANAELRSDAYIQDRTRPGQGLLNISLDSPDPAAKFTLSGNLENVINKTSGSTLNIAMGTVDNLTIDEFARNAVLNLDINSTAKNLNLDVATTVTGVGDIDKLNVNAPGSTVEMLPDTINIRPGITATIAGEEMNAAQAIESSSDPRLLAGYPKVSNVAPNSATSAYMGNKAGTVYWAVSTTTDGSIPEDELVKPTEGNTRIVLGNNLPLTDSNKEFTAALEKLEPDTNYYLSTVMVDARDRHSPVKVASFTTPDNTVPKFASGYPVVLRNYCESVKITGKENGAEVTLTDRDSEQFPKRNYRVQVAAMPNKTCQLYYALYEPGGTAPTAQKFRTGALDRPIRSGAEETSKNRISYIELTNLEELKTYDLYLCLIDADGARSSEVKKVTFTTTDGKPPRFLYDTPTVAEEGINSLRLNVNVNENATVYWVASKSDKYIKDNLDGNGNSEWSDEEWWERACRQIEGGGGGNVVRSGSVSVRANTDTAINITGLDPATSYYVYFVAKDRATQPNYSEFFRADHDYEVTNSSGKDRPEVDVKHNEQPFKYFIQANTLDNVPPEVKQEFTHPDPTDPMHPYADTDIKLIFTEEVMQYSTNRNNTQETLVTFKSLYDKVKGAKAKLDAEPTNETYKNELKEARDNLATVLRSTIKLYNASSVTNETVVDRSDPYASNLDKWIVDYRYVEVDVDDETGALTLFFPGEFSEKDSEKWALNLSSGSTYYFVLDDIADISTSRNRMSRTQLDNFTTVSAQVRLRTVNVTTINWQKEANVTEAVPIDMAFSMTPVTTNVENDVDWDILFWSDYSVKFEVYELDPNTGMGTPVRKVNDGVAAVNPTEVEITNKSTVVNQDTKVDDYQGYEGRSLFRDFYGLSSFPSVTGKGHVISDKDTDEGKALRKSGTMTNDEPKYYGIHFTEIGKEPERSGRDKVWDATVNFRISVLTGSSSDLLTLSRSITKDTLKDMEENFSIAQIHSPRPFFLRAQFANSDAPEFASSWPQFENTDTTMTINVELTRPGRLYWVVAPASTKVRQPDNTIKTNYVPTIDTYAYEQGSADGVKLQYNKLAASTAPEYQRYHIKGSGEGAKPALVPLNGSDSADPSVATVPHPFELTTPANDQIYSPNFTSDRIKYGSLDMARGIGTIEVTDLEPDTIYLVYFVMQGTGQVYSPRAQVFQTRTEEIRRPHLVLQNNTSSATVTSTNMAARADCGLFLLDGLKDMALFKKTLPEVLNPEQAADFAARYPDTRKDKNGKQYNQYTVLEAMNQTDLDGRGGSLFDLFANEDYKNQVAQMIRAEGSSDRIDGKRELYIPGGATSGVEYTSSKMVNDAIYALLVVARADAGDSNATGHSLGFGAAYPMYIRDDEPPRLTAISGEMTVDFQADGANNAPGKFLMGGYVILTFDRSLYLYNKDADDRKALTGATVNGKDGTGFLAAGSDSTITVSSVTGASAATLQTVKLALPIGATKFPNNTVILVNPYLAGHYSPARQQHQLHITLTYDAAKKQVVAGVSSPDLWEAEGMTNMINTTVKAPNATDISLETSSLKVQKDATATLSAQLIDTGSNGEIRWTVDDGAGNIGISPSIGETITVRGLSKGSAKITAHLYVNGTEVQSAKKSCTVTVTPILLKTIELSTTSVTLGDGNANLQKITVTVSPDDAENKDIVVTPDDSTLVAIAKVPLPNGKYELRISRGSVNKTGETNVSVTAADGGPAYNYFYVTVK